MFRKRDRDLAKDLVQESRELLKTIESNFDELRRVYRDARPELTDRRVWRDFFDNER